MNRIALHHSTVLPLSPVDLVAVAHEAGFDSIGLRVASADEASRLHMCTTPRIDAPAPITSRKRRW